MRINRGKIRKRQLKQIKNRRKKNKEEELDYKLYLLKEKYSNGLLLKYR